MERMRLFSQRCFRFAVLLILLAGAACTQVPQQESAPAAQVEAPASPPEVAEPGDWVVVEYAAYFNGSQVLNATAAGIIGEGELPGWAERLAVGMRTGEERSTSIPPEEAFGEVNTSLIGWEPRRMVLPRRVVMEPGEFLREFGVEPEPGREVRLRLYSLRVVEASNTSVVVERWAERRSLSSECGNLSISQNATAITYLFTPVLNRTCTKGGRFLRYLKVNATHVLVDRNHPLAGRWLRGKVRLLELVKGDARGEVWLSSLDLALRVSVAERKPVLAYLANGSARLPYPEPWLVGLNRSAVMLRLTPGDARELGVNDAPAFAVLGKERVVVHGIPPPAQLWELVREAGE